MNKTIFALLMLTMLVISCSGGGIGGPQSSPEAVAEAYLEAIIAGDCEKAATYVAADERSYAVDNFCGPEMTTFSDRVLYASPDDVIVRLDDWGGPNITYVGVIGLRDAYETERFYSEWNIRVEEIDGKWYVQGLWALPGTMIDT